MHERIIISISLQDTYGRTEPGNVLVKTATNQAIYMLVKTQNVVHVEVTGRGRFNTRWRKKKSRFSFTFETKQAGTEIRTYVENFCPRGKKRTTPGLI